jgi:lipoate---protein ligase
MICIHDHHTDPYFNLAAEEYVLKNFSDDCFMLWRNGPSIIVGKHQNTLAEINLDYVMANNIKVVRRLSGGGAVFHDLGNLNFTFIVSGEDGNLVDFRKFTRPILEVLQKLGVEARFEGRNDLTINGLKFSGNAEHVYRNRTLHHGTLLFSAVMADLSQALKVNPLKFTDKAVKSVRSRVTNISEHLAHPMTVEAFSDMIMQHIRDNYGGDRLYAYSEADIRAIEKLRDEKYSQWDWNFGYSPRYAFEKGVRANGGYIECHLHAEKGVIHDIRIHGDFFHRYDIGVIEKALLGVRHEPAAIRQCLSAFDIDDYFRNISVDELMTAMF